MDESGKLVLGFHHPGIVVPDLEQGIRFYSQLLGYEVLMQSEWRADSEHFNQIIGLQRSAARFCMLKGPNAYLELFEYSAPAPAPKPPPSQANELGIRHIAFVVADAAQAVARCVALGGAKINDPVVVPGRAAAVYCRDPFGNLLEFVKPLGAFPELPGAVSRHEAQPVQPEPNASLT